MSRSPLAYPLTRGIDGDSGGAADLQTDVMRFMAILSLCLVAIFALVQSLPIEAQSPTESKTVESPPPPAKETAPTEELQMVRQATRTPVEPEPVASITLTRPKWVSTYLAPKETTAAPEKPAAPPPRVVATADPEPLPEPAPQPADKVFTLRFESDSALTRLVATGEIAFFAISSGRAHRMTVSNSRISFWDASTPNTFHEMEASTVPRPVVDALVRTGADAANVEWGVTLPGKLSAQLNSLMQKHSGGALVIRADGNLNLEQS